MIEALRSFRVAELFRTAPNSEVLVSLMPETLFPRRQAGGEGSRLELQIDEPFYGG